MSRGSLQDAPLFLRRYDDSRLREGMPYLSGGSQDFPDCLGMPPHRPLRRRHLFLIELGCDPTQSVTCVALGPNSPPDLVRQRARAAQPHALRSFDCQSFASALPYQASLELSEDRQYVGHHLPLGVVVSTPKSSATSAQPSRWRLSIRPAKSMSDRERRSSLATRIPSVRPLSTARSALQRPSRPRRLRPLAASS
jgi:hypothetical protein